jgi:molybdopterin-biosynthesis enzyme MoeA-like protein
VIGSKILSGRTKDQNIGYIAEYLMALGIDLKEVRVVGDEETAIVDALNALRHRYTYVFTTGGIGPTHGDITAECVAKAFRVPINGDPRALAILHEWGEDDRRRDERGAFAHDAHPQGRGSHPGFWIGNVIDGGRTLNHAGDAR